MLFLDKTMLFLTVQKAQQNSKEIVRLRQTNSSPCSSVQNTATRLRNSIAKLRSKIEQAKTIATSIPVSKCHFTTVLF